ncbi:unnamed protein product [Gongylonema pulchrum]|uniref:PH domain-containing protein n=1 Tax=Gongylonema pulchrum TaxID=637853 RepID=A0A183EB61_9BILA|nr:unnamed protein product [Gongylonema pulchrum]
MKENSTSVHFDAEPSSPEQLAPEEQTLPVPTNNCNENAAEECAQPGHSEHDLTVEASESEKENPDSIAKGLAHLKISPSNGIDEKAKAECGALDSTCLSGKKEVGGRGETGVLSRGRKKRYLRGQILAIRKAFSEEQWLQYAKALYGDALKSQPFKKCEIVKESTSDMPKTKKIGKCVIQTKKQNEQKSYEMKQNKAPLLASVRLLMKTSRDKTFGILDGKCRRMKANFYHELSVEMGNKMERGTSTTVATQTYVFVNWWSALPQHPSDFDKRH